MEDEKERGQEKLPQKEERPQPPPDRDNIKGGDPKKLERR
jgi:hypothetical protein